MVGIIRNGRLEHVHAFGRELQHGTLVPLDLAQVYPRRVAAVEPDLPQQAFGDTIERGFPASQPVVEPRDQRDGLRRRENRPAPLP